MMSAALAPGAAAIVLFGTFLVLFVLRVPVAFALGLACLPSLVIESRLSPMMLFNETFKAYNSFILLAVPFYLLTANLMNSGGVTDRLVRLSRAMVGNFPGALAQINVVLSVFFAGISGSSTADAASQAKIFIDAQSREGYGLSFSIAITAVSAVLAVIIPPSILMTVWGGVISPSIGAMFFYREIDMKGLYEALTETGRLSAVALFCVGTASAFGWMLAYYQIPKALLENVTTWGMGITAVGFFIAFVFLVVGCFLDAIPAIIIVGTILQPLAQSVHMHPIHFAIIGIVSLAFGLVTPPYGLCLMISCAVAKVPLRFALKDTLIMLVPMLLMLAAIILWPEIPLILPKLVAPELLK